jgi:hypothetical protein
MHAIAADEVAIVQVHGFLEMVDAQRVLCSDRACQRIRRSRRTECVVRRELGERALAQPVHARIPNMDQMGTPAAQDQCTQSARHPVERRVRAAERVYPPIHGVGGPRADAGNAERRRLTEARVDEAANRGFGRDAATARAAHAVRQHGHEADS